VIDEVNQVQEPSPRERLHVLLSVDMDKSPPPHRPLPVRAQDKDFPISWIRNEEKGRVFYFGLAHNPTAFWDAPLLEHILAGIQYALGDLKADATPSANLASRKK
jgi:type 1 glutamine amidotransferase